MHFNLFRKLDGRHVRGRRDDFARTAVEFCPDSSAGTDSAKQAKANGDANAKSRIYGLLHDFHFDDCLIFLF